MTSLRLCLLTLFLLLVVLLAGCAKENLSDALRQTQKGMQKMEVAYALGQKIRRLSTKQDKARSKKAPPSAEEKKEAAATKKKLLETYHKARTKAQSHFVAAEKIYRKLLQQKPKDPLLLNNLGHLMLWLNKPLAAQRHLQEAQKLASGHLRRAAKENMTYQKEVGAYYQLFAALRRTLATSHPSTSRRTPRRRTASRPSPTPVH